LQAGEGAPAGRPFAEEDRSSLEGHWTAVSGELTAIWGAAPTIVFAPQRIGLSPFISGVNLNAHAYHWLTMKAGPRGQDWDFNITGSVARIFFRRPDDARSFQLLFK
jgi:hypothetical protein